MALLPLAATLLAKGKGKGGILQPQMTVERGTYKAPFGRMGEKPAAAWTATTLGASVDDKPNAGQIMEVSGPAATVRGFSALYVQGFLKK